MKPAELKKIRIQLDLTQKELAEKLECSEISIRLWETGNRPIRKMTSYALQWLAHLKKAP
jgi:DNA-binding transcriptional regulator YiaG